VEVKDPQESQQSAVSAKAENILKVLLSALRVIFLLLLLNFISNLGRILIRGKDVNVALNLLGRVLVHICVWVERD